MSETAAVATAETAEAGPSSARPTKEKRQTSGFIVFMLTIACVGAAVASYFSFQTSATVAGVLTPSIVAIDANVTALGRTIMAVQNNQNRMMSPYRHEFEIQIPAGATSCRVSIEQSPDSKAYDQKVVCH